MPRRAEQDDRRGQAIAMLGVAGALMVPTPPRLVLWLMRREPLFRELRSDVRTVRTVLRPQIVWVAVFAVALVRARRRSTARRDDAPAPEAVPLATSAVS